DVIEVIEHLELELCPIIGHERRRAPVDLGEEVEEVERERIGVVDEQSSDHSSLLGSPWLQCLHCSRGQSLGSCLIDRSRHFLDFVFEGDLSKYGIME